MNERSGPIPCRLAHYPNTIYNGSAHRPIIGYAHGRDFLWGVHTLIGYSPGATYGLHIMMNRWSLACVYNHDMMTRTLTRRCVVYAVNVARVSHC
jgi:hypothetical protein